MPRSLSEALGCGLVIDWSAALARHDRWLRTVVLARVGERQAVDDVMQEVSLAAVRQSAPLADPERIAPWLYRLAVRQALLYRRREGRQRRVIGGYGERIRPSDTDDRSHDPLAWLLADEQRRTVRQAVDRLPRGDAEILMLKYTEGWSYRQLADHLGASPSAVEARLHRARAKLRTKLAAMGAIAANA
jgi:RNA polymerase sigma factor (sigma-70 family)